MNIRSLLDLLLMLFISLFVIMILSMVCFDIGTAQDLVRPLPREYEPDVVRTILKDMVRFFMNKEINWTTEHVFGVQEFDSIVTKVAYDSVINVCFTPVSNRHQQTFAYVQQLNDTLVEISKVDTTQTDTVRCTVVGLMRYGGR